MSQGQKQQTPCEVCKNAVYEGPVVFVDGHPIPVKRRQASKCELCPHKAWQERAKQKQDRAIKKAA